MKPMFKMLTVGAALALGLPVSACLAPGEAHVSARVSASPPTLAYVGPGLWVVSDYDEPLFYSDGYYWLYRDGVWLRSSTFTGSYVRVSAHVVPRPVLRVDRPHRYVRYHPPRHARVHHGPPPGHARVRVRDHRHVERRDHRHVERRDHRRDEARGERDHRHHHHH